MAKKKIVFILIVILVLLGSGFLIKNILDKEDTITEIKVKNEIVGWAYTLDDRDTSLMKENFEKLKIVLESETVDEAEYAKLLAKLYIIDLYTIDNKLNSYDIPCLEYVEPSTTESFKLNILNTIYKDIDDNSYNKRNQELPVVKDIEIIEIIETKYTLEKVEYTGYQVTLNWEYEKDLGYDQETILTLIKQDKKIYVVKQEEVL